MRKRPTILTITTASAPVKKSLLDRVDRFVIEHSGAKEDLRRVGIEEERICLIHPPVDLERYCPVTEPDGPFTVIFASSPEDKSWLEARGIPQILHAAMLRPQMRFRLLWRPWGNSEATVRRWIATLGLQNVEVAVGCFSDMPAEYNKAHVTIAPFTDASRSKAAPNSVIESLACGRPVLVTGRVGLADLIRDARAGMVCAASAEEIAESLDRLEADWHCYSQAARKLASCFGVKTFLAEYQRLYEEVLANANCLRFRNRRRDFIHDAQLAD
jgi:glycosyltransferase involved in cell wall biosynthesis